MNEAADIMVREATPDDARSWDAFVLANDSGTFFHKFSWSRVIESSFGHEPHYLVAEQEDELVGVVTQQDIFFSTMTLGATRDAASPGAAGVSALTVGDIMTRPAVSADETTELSSLCRIMTRLRIHRIPIVSRGRVTGLVSSLDVCRAVGERGLG